MGACTAALLFGAPIAVQAAGEGEPLEGGVRNPGNSAQELQRETQIIADTAKDSYGTRQSNKGAGGAAIYGCRAGYDPAAPGDPARSTPCLRVNNLEGGKAFDFVADEAPTVGVIQAGNSLVVPRPDRAPFVTNANAVAFGLNADRVDNLHADELIARAVEQARQAVAGGPSAPGEAQGTDPACPDGTVARGGGCLETTAREAADYDTAARTCGDAGRQLTPANVLVAARDVDGIDLNDGELSADTTVSDALPVVGQSLGNYTTVTDGGDLGAAAFSEENAYRCYIP